MKTSDLTKAGVKEFRPISKSRIEVVDALRGFALLGVLFANVPYSHDPSIVGAFNETLDFLYNLLISKKFITIFSILFGFGFYIQMSRVKKTGVHFKSYFLKRMALLFLIGTIHCFVLWNGDIIMSYAFGGVFLLLIRNWSVKKTIILAIIFNVVLTGIVFIGNSALEWLVYDYDYGLTLIQPTTNSYWEYLRVNMIMAPWLNFLKDMPITLVYTFGNMLIGVILGKLDFFRLPVKLKKITNGMILLGFTVGLTASYFYHLVMTGELELDIPLLWVPFVLAAGMIIHALGYVALFVRLYQKGFFKKILQGFTYVGKTALTNYITQSVFYLLVIFHCLNPFGLFGSISALETYLIAAIFFVFQSIVSYLWLRERSQGPLEYAWKKLSYSKQK